jgi:hypothetical protein
MKSVTLVRLFAGTHGTFGRLSVQGRSWWTVERQADGLHPRIPAGVYPLAPATFFGGDGPGGKPDYPAYALTVPGRDQIKIHVANWAYQLKGCIAPGLTVEYFGGPPTLGVTSSGDAFRYFMAAMDGDVGELTVSEDF